MTAAPSRLAAAVTEATQALLAADREPADLHARVIDAVERPLLEAVLAHARGNQSRAAKWLGLTRTTLRRKVQKFGLQDA
jgi:Fis family transcriptional regulator, factor for inversion stimulation protein